MDLRDQLQNSLGKNYTLERELSGGGMSRVFVAEEHTLGRKIVVKVVPPERVAGVSVQRFKREIQVAARLQHPHIVPVLSAGETDGLPFYTMPFVKGESLRARLSRGGELSVNESLHLMRDIASALAYAHAEGVVHRDIKPDNVIISGGVGVVTDFGVAKAIDVAATDSEGHSTGLTSLGVALGTPAYMSPEQASADPHVDHRADIYSFGCVAYEMLTGTTPFGGRPLHQILAAHVTEEPESIARRRPLIPAPLGALVMQCLQKRPGDRPQSAMDLLTELDAIATPSGGTSPTSARMPAATAANTRRTRWIIGAAAVVVVGILAAWMAYNWVPKPYSVGATTPIAVSPAREWHPSISPDGRFVAYSAETPQGLRIFTRQIDGGRPVMVSGDLPGNHDRPRWSPDGSRLLFVAPTGIFTVPAFGGGAVRRLLEAQSVGVGPGTATDLVDGDWSPDGRWLANTDGVGLWVRPSEGGTPRRVIEGTALHEPVWSPDGKRIAYVNGQSLRLGNISTSAIWVVPAAGGTPTRVTDVLHVNTSPAWTPDGRALVFVSTLGGALDLYEQPVRASGAPIGAPVRLSTGLSPFTVSIARNVPRAAYDAVRVQSNVYGVVAGSAGHATPMTQAKAVTDENQVIEAVNISKDGRWLAYDSNRGGNYDIYKIPVDGGEPIQLTNDSANDFFPSFSHDGREISFHTTRNGTRDIYTMSVDGGSEHPVTQGPSEDLGATWSPAGPDILFFTLDSLYTLKHIHRQSDGTWSQPKTLLTLRSMNYPLAFWAPDGKRYVVVGNDAVSVGSIEGGARSRIADRHSLGDSPETAAWAGDPNILYVSARAASGGNSFWQVPLTGGRPRRLVSDDSAYVVYRAIFATDGLRFFYTRRQVQADVWLMQLKR